MEHVHRCLEVKEVTESGSFEGMASVYGNIDLGNDIVAAGAFKEFAYTKDKKIRLFDGHNTRLPVGKGEVTDSHMGLVIKGQLNLKVSRARDVYELMKDGVIDGLSVGFDILQDGFEVKDGVRIITAAKLWEVSVTPFPMNPQTLVSQVKQQVMKQITSVREYEAFLRDSGFSKAQAVVLAKAFKDLSGQGEPAPTNELTPSPEFMQFLKGLDKVI
jgi:HK97 family phage prohead protease